MVIASLLLLPPVVDPVIERTPLTPLSAVFFVCIGIAAGVIALRRPQWSMGVIAFAIPFAFYRDVLGTTITLEKVVVIGVAVGLVLRGAPLVPASASARRILIAGLVVLGAIVISGAQATFVWPVVREALKQIEYLVMFWCAASLVIDRGEDTRWLEGGVFAAVSIVAFDAIAQALFGGAPSGVWVDHQALPRVAGPLEGPNQLAGFLEAALPLLILSPLLGRRGIGTLQWIAVAATMMALVLSQSRAGIAVAILGFGLVWFINRETGRKALVPFLVGTCAGLAIAVGWYWGATHDAREVLTYLFRLVLPQNPGGVGTRNELWEAAIALFVQHPLFGIGAGNFEFLLSTVGLQNVQTHANSVWLETLAEQGIIGFSAFVALVAVVLRELFIGLRRSWLVQAALVATLCLLLHQVFDDLFFFPKVGMLWWLLIGAAAGALAPAAAPAAARSASAPAELREHATPIA